MCVSVQAYTWTQKKGVGTHCVEPCFICVSKHNNNIALRELQLFLWREEREKGCERRGQSLTTLTPARWRQGWTVIASPLPFPPLLSHNSQGLLLVRLESPPLGHSRTMLSSSYLSSLGNQANQIKLHKQTNNTQQPFVVRTKAVRLSVGLLPQLLVWTGDTWWRSRREFCSVAFNFLWICDFCNEIHGHYTLLASQLTNQPVTVFHSNYLKWILVHNVIIFQLQGAANEGISPCLYDVILQEAQFLILPTSIL